ncbi:hypothetical protein ERO13_D07G146350v2 [Gossypium hirsutum]|uniref:Pentacotripeptide-repeat region of PRORP domain-containing protein n=4 Tax=Gossypium TaxID=3633 RepID=A0A5J5QT24_GOSBA|nr:hypothetical protein ES319_D07G157400v1 [Gossypium barbadense]KAG4138636.1 hypothetical protein ERO13_D07G146350v2 [Gossypium hirsutum]TYG61668.1 hypothetical protein ES288_D07G167600v1 [Gossypium darwinii]TYH63078.1 hypothetical protein ES332_D07G165600v1 [Gossypium tomentosum]TYI73891.1 hypothetical protein E1A91_D07G161400v1 [Gossypium mustelinum]
MQAAASNVLPTLSLQGMLVEAKALVESMEKIGDLMNLDSYNIWLLGLLRNSKLVEAHLVLKDMVDKGVEPNIYSYNIVMDGLCKNGMLSDTRMVMGFIVRSGLSPDTVTYARMFYHIFDPASFMPVVDDLGKEETSMRLMNLQRRC